jgi:hypothetical protein
MIIGILGLAALAIAVICLNVWYNRERKTLTPEQRKKADKELSFFMWKW